MKLVRPTFDLLLDVAERMREWDRREIYAMRWKDDPAELAYDCSMTGHFAWIAGLDRPIAAIGAHPTHPGNWTVWCFGTDEVPRIGLPLTRFVKRIMMPSLAGSGARRASCLSIEGHVEAHRWLEALGATRESTLRAFGKDGEDFYCYAWTR